MFFMFQRFSLNLQGQKVFYVEIGAALRQWMFFCFTERLANDKTIY